MTDLRTARAAIFTGHDRAFVVAEQPVPQPGPGQALLRIELTGICGTDAHIVETGAASPMALGHEISGRLIAAGDGVTHDLTGRPIREGDLIVPHPGAQGGAYGFRSDALSGPPHLTGGFGEVLNLCYSDSALFRVDADPEVAVLLEPLSIAIHALDRARPRIGDTVIVQGTGAIGLLTIFLARRTGAVSVIAIGGPRGRLELAASLGADACIDISDHADSAALVAAALELTPGGAGADVVVECAGARSAVVEGLELTRKGGTFCEVGHFVDIGDVTINPNRHLVLKDLTLVAPYGSSREHFVRSRAILEHAGDDLRGLVSHRIPLDRLPEAFDALLGRFHLDGRDVIKIAVDPRQA